MKKIYLTPMTETLDMETTDVMAGSPPATIDDPTIGNSREIYDALWDDIEE